MMVADWLLLAVVLSLLAALCWMVWLYVHTYRRLVQSDRDRDRLIRRIGTYYNLPLALPTDDHFPPAPTDHPIPPAFRTRRPQPPPGYRPKGGL